MRMRYKLKCYRIKEKEESLQLYIINKINLRTLVCFSNFATFLLRQEAMLDG